MSDPAETNPYPSPVDALRSRVRAILSQVKPAEIYEISESSLPLLDQESRGQPVLLNPGDVTLKNREVTMLQRIYEKEPEDSQSSFATIALELITENDARGCGCYPRGDWSPGDAPPGSGIYRPSPSPANRFTFSTYSEKSPASSMAVEPTRRYSLPLKVMVLMRDMAAFIVSWTAPLCQYG
jgi:hypothetical protein